MFENVNQITYAMSIIPKRLTLPETIKNYYLTRGIIGKRKETENFGYAVKRCDVQISNSTHYCEEE